MQQFVIGNWKMYMNSGGAKNLAKDCAQKMLDAEKSLPKVVLCPSHIHLIPVYEHIKGTAVEMGAQGSHPEKSGPHTGEVSVSQVKDANAKYVIVGHSEHRKEYKDTSDTIKKKAKTVIAHGMRPILCVGESIAEHKAGKTGSKLSQQLHDELPDDITPEQVIIAYEPLWAIGANRTPTKEQIEEIHGLIRYELQQMQPNGNLIPILYGGSVTPENAYAILHCPHVDGVLVGRASVKFEDFWKIVESSDESSED